MLSGDKLFMLRELKTERKGFSFTFERINFFPIDIFSSESAEIYNLKIVLEEL